MAVKNPGYPQWTPGFSHNNQSARDKRMGMIVFFFFLKYGIFNFIRRRLAGPSAGRKSVRGKIKAVKTQSQDLAMWIVNTRIHIFFNFFCQRIVDSDFLCMFTPTNKNN